MKYEPRYYQREAVDACWSYIEHNPGKNPCIVLPTGAGKSLTLSMLIRDAVQEWQGRVLLLSHVRELLTQSIEHIEAVAPDLAGAIGVYSAGLRRRDKDHPVIVASIQSVHSKACELGRFDVILVDECFVGETKILTPMGERRIDNMRSGDLVYCSNGIGRVLATSCRPADSLVTVRFSDGTSFTCTPEHRIFTNSGWVQAGALELGSIALGPKAVRSLWEDFQAVEKGQGQREIQRFQGKFMGQANLLLSILREEIQKSNEQSSVQAQNESQAKGDQAQADQEGRERALTALAAACSIARAGGGVGVRGSDSNGKDKPGRIPDKLQDRHCKQGQDDRDRDRRGITLHNRETNAGRKEVGFTGFARVVDVSHHKCQGTRAVFNLHVSGHPSYFANGKLVHNCHTIPDSGEGMYRSFLEEARVVNPAVRLVGLTATPYRMKTGYICGPDNLLTEICYEISVKQLIDEGFLCNLISKAGVVKADLSGVQVRGGEYVADSLEDAMNTDALVSAACREIVDCTHNRRSNLVFASGVKHGGHIAAALRGHGESVEEVYGETPDKERDATLKAFKAGKIKHIVNVGVLTTGFDYRGIDCVSLLRPTMSPGLYYQMLGRGLRINEGKDNCLILDFASNVLTHGPIDMIRVKPKKLGEPGQAPVKECPDCHGIIHAALTECPHCGHIFGREPNHEQEASFAAPVSGQNRTEVRQVYTVRYSKHVNRKEPEKPPTMRVEYQTGVGLAPDSVSEWICIEHEGWARQKAAAWWSMRSVVACPSSVDAAVALANAGALATCEAVTVAIIAGEKWPKLVGYKLGARPEGEAFSKVRDALVSLEEVELFAKASTPEPAKEPEHPITLQLVTLFNGSTVQRRTREEVGHFDAEGRWQAPKEAKPKRRPGDMEGLPW